MKKQFIYIDLEIFPVKNYIFLNYKNSDKEEIYKELSKRIKTKTALLEIIKKVDEVNIDLDFGQVMSIGSVNVLTMKDYNSDEIISLRTLVHELNHISCNIARYIGIIHTEDSEEFFTYIQDFLLGKVLTEVKKNE